MKWYQHDSSCHNDEIMRDLIHIFGVEGYGIYHICLELISEKIDEKLIPNIRISDRVLREKLRVSHQKMTKILAFFDQNSIIFSNFESGYWNLTCPNLLKRLDNWTKRSVVTPQKVSLQSESDQQSELEREKESKSKKGDYFFSEEQEKEILKAIAKARGWPEYSDATKVCFTELMERVRKKRDLENPYGYALAAARNEGKPMLIKVAIQKPEESFT